MGSGSRKNLSAGWRTGIAVYQEAERKNFDAPCNSDSDQYNKKFVAAGVAQLVEHLICNQRVGGSNPFASSSLSGTSRDLRKKTGARTKIRERVLQVHQYSALRGSVSFDRAQPHTRITRLKRAEASVNARGCACPWWLIQGNEYRTGG